LIDNTNPPIRRLTMTTESKVDSGLEGVVVAESALSRVDGEAGRLIIRGYDIAELAERTSFEQTCALLWEDAAANAATHARYQAALGAARVRAFARLGAAVPALRMRDPMEALRAALALLELEHGDPIVEATAITGATAVLAAAIARTAAGHEPLAPDPTLDHARDYLRMATGRADAPTAEVLGRYLVTVSDHDMNASTFTARVVTSTGSDMVSAIVAAVGAFKGPLHGGAPGPVLDMLDAIAGVDTRSWLEAELASGRRIMGMGHRVYRVRDPRADVLEGAIKRLPVAAGEHPRLDVARKVERAARELLRERHPGRTLDVNVEFYTAVLLDAVGLDRTQFTPTFAVARCAGWCAHVIEQRRTGRLIRPALRYTGPLPELAA
jgi:citrate synthase